MGNYDSPDQDQDAWMGVCYNRPQSQFERGFEWCGWSPGSLGRVR